MMTNHNPKPSNHQLQFHCRIVLTSHDPRAGSELPPCRVLTCGPEAFPPPFNKPLPSVHPERGSNPKPSTWLSSGAGYHLPMSPGWRCQHRGAVLPATPRPHLLCSRTMLSSPLLPASQTPLLSAFKPAVGLLGFLTTCFCSRKEVLEISTLAK